jgi:hypothetical protein
MDPLKPICVRLRTSTVEALRRAQQQSNHRTMAAFVDAILREHLIKHAEPTLDQRLRQAAGSNK